MKLVTISQYAKMCGIKRQAVDFRVKKKRIVVQYISIKKAMIDIEKYPPIKKNK